MTSLDHAIIKHNSRLLLDIIRIALDHMRFELVAKHCSQLLHSHIDYMIHKVFQLITACGEPQCLLAFRLMFELDMIRAADIRY